MAVGVHCTAFSISRELFCNYCTFPQIYGAAVTFFELLPEEDLTEDMRKSLKLHEKEVNPAVSLWRCIPEKEVFHRIVA